MISINARESGLEYVTDKSRSIWSNWQELLNAESRSENTHDRDVGENQLMKVPIDLHSASLVVLRNAVPIPPHIPRNV